MGIQGLLPFLKKIHTPVNVSQFHGCTVAIDAYCWLHKGAFSCAEKLALGEKTEQYVYYCMKYIDYLLRNGLKPILVFDGCHLPSKKDVETSRRERRDVNRKRAAQLLREGRRAEARECLQRCIDITPQMALQLMNVCRARGVDCIVAPYEADAQLAYLNKAGIAQIIITEDSDLLLFGCDKIIFKMDFFGNGVLIERSRLNEVVDIQDGFYTFDKFRYMCILSGCDYLPSLTGIGLVKACKVFKLARQTDLKQLLKKLPTYLKMSLVVTDKYVEGFTRANNTFLYQLVFDPQTQKLCPLTPYSPEVDRKELTYAGPYFSDEQALQIALGNVDIHTNEKIADFNPETYTPKYAKKQENELLHMLSIWNPAYRPRSKVNTSYAASDKTMASRPCLVGKEVEVKNALSKRTPVKQTIPVEDSTDVKTDVELTHLYAAAESKKRKIDTFENNQLDDRTEDIIFSHADKEADDLKTSVREKSSKKILSPSKMANQEHSRENMSTNEAFFQMEQETTTETTQLEKENRKVVSSTRNKFAISALAKRAKFSLDSTALPSAQVEVKSRYFGTAVSSPSSATSDNNNSATENISRLLTDEGQSETSPNPQNTSVHHHSELHSNQTADQAESSTWPSYNRISLQSGFGYKSEKSTEDKGEIRCTHLTRSLSKSGEVGTSASSPSLSSAFTWSNFKYIKSSSSQIESSSLPCSATSNKPFKRVTSEGNANKKTSNSSQGLDIVHYGVDSSKADCDSFHNVSDTVTHSGGSSDPNESSPKDSQKGEGDSCSDVCWSQRSSNASDVDASQHSNLYSIDSDCFPTSQDFVDLTECEADSPSVTNLRHKGSKFSSPTPYPQVSLKSSKCTPRSTSGLKKCRVSGLSRGQKKLQPSSDEKQQKIRDMFSRFSHQKGKNLKTGVLSCAEKQAEEDLAGSAQGSSTPSNPQLAFPTNTHRKLLLS